MVALTSRQALQLRDFLRRTDPGALLMIAQLQRDHRQRISVRSERKDKITYSKWPPKTMPSSHLCVNCFRVSKIVLHGFCTESARFHPVQRLTTGAKFTSGCETLINGEKSLCIDKNFVFYGGRHNGGITPDLRYESVGPGFESLPGAPNNKIRTFSR